MGNTGNCQSGLVAAGLLSRLADIAGDDRAAAEASSQIAWFCLQLGLPDRGHDAAIAAKRAWVKLRDIRGQAIASSILSWLLVEMGLVDEAFIEAAHGLDLAERQGHRDVLAFARNAKAVTYLYCRQDHLALPLLEEALETLRPGEAPSLRSLVLTNLAYSQVSLAEAAELAGDTAAGHAWRIKAIATNNLAIATASGCGDLWNLRTALCNGAEYHVCLGEIGLGEHYLDRWLQLPGDIGLRSRIHYLYTRGELLTKADRLHEALAVCQTAADLAENHKQADHKANTSRRLAEVFEALGDHEAALRHYKRFHAAFEAQMGETTRRRAQHVESTLENEKLRDEATTLRFQAQHDVLTGLPNRRSFEAALLKLEDTQFCLAILDLDRFKAVNDNHSHVVGDAVLRKTAEILAQCGALTAFRLGGEEFALLFVDQSLAEASVEAEEARLKIAECDWAVLSPGLAVTASIGLACSTSNTFPKLIEAADRLLYRAKAEGRNKLVAG
ncbi:tetratricopeptide repeat-containing diguanylate cyclase [Pelagibacterium lacus]|nr:tetratricopeptide repeat-containing diguanylate cyclase [Pelagibacterium lacus]